MSNAVSWQMLRDLAIAGVVAGALCALLIRMLMPVLARYALARPNARSSHKEPTPQGGGIAVIAAVLVVTLAVSLLSPGFGPITARLLAFLAAVIVIALVGCVDDIYTIEVLPRLSLQILAVTATVVALPPDIHIVHALPVWLERGLLVIAGVWFVNLVNFMDGIDWLTVVEVVPVTAVICIVAIMGASSPDVLLIAVSLLAATLGFAPFNRPVARLFLGDVGSLPIGLLLFWLLARLAGSGHLAAALILPLYYIADATATLLRRALNGEPITQAHRTHFYQRATERGMSVWDVLARVASVNLVLGALAIISIALKSLLVDIATLLVAFIAVAWLLLDLARGKR